MRSEWKQTSLHKCMNIFTLSVVKLCNDIEHPYY